MSGAQVPPVETAQPGGAVPHAWPLKWGSDAGAEMFGAQELAAYARDGFVQVPGLLDPQEVAGYQAELDRLATDPDGAP